MKKLYLVMVLIFPIMIFAQRDFHKAEQERKISAYKKLFTNQPIMTQNQGYYDVSYYRIELDINPATEILTGKIGINAKILNASISIIDLNLTNGLTVDSIILNNKKTTFTYSSDMLNIKLDRAYSIGENISTTIYYHGKPNSAVKGSYGISIRNNNSSDYLIWSLSEPFGARDWWPCKDFPDDKADSADIIITVPNNLTVASNGTLLKISSENGKNTYFWHESYPIATYLISVTAYQYQIVDVFYQYKPDSSLLIRNYVFPDHYSRAKPVIDKTSEMVKIFSEMFGPYPFMKEKYGQAEFLWSGGMEHQTCTSLGVWDEYLSVHELAHQWWGDMVTCKDFHHIWMNEGFATYSESLYAEKVYGKAEYSQTMNVIKYTYSGTIYVSDLSDVNRIFSTSLTYNKASWVLHMLRHVVGDTTFFNILKSYYNDQRYQYKVVTTENFRDLCESLYGKDLDWFFEQWIYQEFCPNYQCIKQLTYDGNLTKVKIILNQQQSNYIFKMPVDINISTSSGDTTFVVGDSLKSQEFNFIVKGTVKSIDVDKDNWILKQITYLTNVDEGNAPKDYSLFQNYPNPFNNETKIKFSLKEAQEITIKLYNVLGNEIKTITKGYFPAGIHTASFNAKDIPSGIYFYRLNSSDFRDMRKLVLIK